MFQPVPTLADVAVWRTGATVCPRCGGPVLHARPGRTTVGEIRDFARRAGWEEIERDGWIHPGCYCPSGCVRILAEYEPDLFLVSPGPNRQRVILYIRQRFRVSIAEARALVDAGPHRVGYGESAWSEDIRRQLQEMGAEARYGWGEGGSRSWYVEVQPSY